ncbi:MAG: hypothetical protein AB1486_08560 [Planctomycetota bacterium]
MTIAAGSLLGLGLPVARAADNDTLSAEAAQAPEIAAGGRAQGDQDLSEADRAQVMKAFSKLPLCFVEKRGQMDQRVAYYVKGWEDISFTPGLEFIVGFW